MSLSWQDISSAIHSMKWKEDPVYLNWIVNNFDLLLDDEAPVSEVSANPEFWRAVWDLQNQSGNRTPDTTDATVTSTVSPAPRKHKLVDYSDSEEQEETATKISKSESFESHHDWMEKHCGHGGCFLQVAKLDDSLCLARALVLAKARIDRHTDPAVAAKWGAIRKNNPHGGLQQKMAEQLMHQAGLEDHIGECGETEIGKLQAVLEPEYQIKIFSAQHGNQLSFQGKIQSEKVLHIYHDVNEDGKNAHFLVVSRPHVLFKKRYWCDKCNKAFCNKHHKCVPNVSKD